MRLNKDNASNAAKARSITFLRGTATGSIMDAFNTGRETQAEGMADQIDRVQSSALLDPETCDYCAALDGQETPYDQFNEADAPPYKNCGEGYGKCRCVLVYIFKRERPAAPGTELPEINLALIRDGELLLVQAAGLEPRNKAVLAFAAALDEAKRAVSTDAQHIALIKMEGLEDAVRAVIDASKVAPPTPGRPDTYGEAVAKSEYTKASIVLGVRKEPWDMTREEYDNMPIVYRGESSESAHEGHVFVSNSQDIAAAHGSVRAYRILPGSRVYPDPEVQGEQDRPLSGGESLNLGSAVVDKADLVPVDWNVWKH